jgi:hypothetical protein
MKNFNSFFEENNKNNKTNKFNIHWQIVRTKARSIKSVKEKLEYVLGFLKQNPNQHNYNRIANWVKMTGVAYPDGSPQREAFTDALNDLEENMEDYINIIDDMDNDLSEISTEDLKLVLKDLSKRKYNFQFNKTPQDHIDFINAVEDELKKRQ